MQCEIADGKRVMKSSGTLYWYGTGSDAVMETDLSNNMRYNYFFFGGQRVGRSDISNSVTWYFGDHLGSSRVVWSTAANDNSDFYPFGGERVITSGTANTYKFTGKERDAESGLDYFGARYYASSMGRWMSPDWSSSPSGVPYADLGDPQSLNLYNYMRNNPLGGVDADGHWPDWLKSAATGAGKWIANQVTGNNVALSRVCSACGEATGVMNMAGQNTAIYQSPSNTAEAVGYYGAAGAQVASAVLLPEYGGSVTVTAEEGISDAALAGRANAVQAAQDAFGQTKSTTAAASVTDANGNTSVMVGSSRNSLTPSQRAALQPGETAVTGAGHAETTVINAAQSQGMTVNSVAASRPACPTCSQAIQDAGARQVTQSKPQ
jgi:RHS repeat-associated protein